MFVFKLNYSIFCHVLATVDEFLPALTQLSMSDMACAILAEQAGEGSFQGCLTTQPYLANSS